MNDFSPVLNPMLGWVLLFGLSIIWIAFGLYLNRKVRNLEGFLLAGRNVGLAFGTATVMATWVTSNTTMLAPQFALEFGIWGMLAYSTASFGLFLFAPLAKRIRQLMPRGYTSGDFIRLRYGKPTWMVFLFISIFYALTWLISMGMAGGILLEALAGIPYILGMSVLLGVCVIYTLCGGLYAVIGTDFLQSVIIAIGVVIVGAGVLSTIEAEAIYHHVLTEKPMLMNMLLPAALLAFFNNLLFGIGEIIHSNVWWSRAFALRESVGQRAYVLAGFLWLPIPIASGFLALSTGVLGMNVPRADMVGPLVSSHVLGSLGSIITFIVLFCSLASSLDSLLAGTADLITRDFGKKWLYPTADDSMMRKLSVATIIGLGMITWIACLPRIGTLATVLFVAGPMVASTIWPIATGLLWKRANWMGACGGMVLGSVGGLLAYFAWGWYSGALVGGAISMLTVLLFTMTREHDFAWSTLNEPSSETVVPT